MRMSGWWTGCWRARNTVSDGVSDGSTSSVMPTPTASSSIRNARTHGDTAITSSRVFNGDKPFDRFLKEQIAGDEIWPGDKDALIALGFHRAGPEHVVGGNQDVEMNRQEVLTEMTAGVARFSSAMTMNCARCHNHKFDPILQSDYYRLQAVFAEHGGQANRHCRRREKALATRRRRRRTRRM